MKLSLTEENYLKTISHLAGEGGEVTVKGLSDILKIKMPTVTSMMKKLSEKDLIKYEPYRPLYLTEQGSRIAGKIIRKHRLTEMYLVEKMGFGWEEVHEIAEQVEHVHSPVFFERIDKLLDYPKYDPHGSPIPNREGVVENANYDKLSSCKSGDTFTIRAVMYSEDDFLSYLNNREIKLGSELTIESVEPFDQSMVVTYKDHAKETLSYIVCDRLLGNLHS